MKVFIVSQCKNATTSLYKAISLLTGEKVYDWLGPQVIKEEEYNWDFIWSKYDEYNINHDDPIPFIYTEVHKRYPDAKFILSYRNPEIWVESFSHGFKRRWDSKYKIKQTLYQSINFDEDILVEKYKNINREILEYASKNIPAENFLHFDIGKLSTNTNKENWELLSNFLQVPLTFNIVNSPFPKHRVRKK